MMLFYKLPPASISYKIKTCQVSQTSDQMEALLEKIFVRLFAIVKRGRGGGSSRVLSDGHEIWQISSR